MTGPTASAPSQGSLATLRKLLFGVIIFCLVVGGWAAWQFRAGMHEVLPGAGGRQGRCVLWFVGSSSIARWTTLADDMAPWTVHNRGVRGAFLPELRQRLATELPQLAPDAIIFYGGDNDIADGRSAADTADQFRQLIAVTAARMPGVPMLALSVKPSPGRWALRAVQRDYDRALSAMAARDPDLVFVDATSGLLAGGKPGPYFDRDRIHLDPAGYRVWADVVHAALARTLSPAEQARCTHRPLVPANG